MSEWVSLLSILSLQGKRREASLACSTSSGFGGDVVEAAAAASTFLRPSPPPFKSQDGEIGIKLPHVAAGKGE